MNEFRTLALIASVTALFSSYPSSTSFSGFQASPSGSYSSSAVGAFALHLPFAAFFNAFYCRRMAFFSFFS